MEGKGKHSDKDPPSLVEFPSQETGKVDDAQASEGNETRRRRTRSEVWGTDPTRRSERFTNPSDKVLVTRVHEHAPEIKIPRAYTDAVRSPEGKLWKDAMDYELTKLEEMSTWSDIDKSDVPHGVQILPGMWVHIVKNLESRDKKFRS